MNILLTIILGALLVVALIYLEHKVHTRRHMEKQRLNILSGSHRSTAYTYHHDTQGVSCSSDKPFAVNLKDK